MENSGRNKVVMRERVPNSAHFSSKGCYQD